ncbi:helix-turn-helix transcriptional regulator ['Paenibacillus yunnanensis' Narsing Rao et al. 2020]|uniref:helix-turn-helix transcriptional regulator n=1 Tax=Paenibacillus tengchongensis TaxID=2608684 RepID=UPI00124F090F|nr:YafY family protein [Paenibacillus tengchongensis]
MNKIERLISIVMILLQKNIVSTTEFSQLLNVSKRTIIRDMETLSLANIPIYALHGVHGGYGIMDEYKIDKRLLSSKDLENILTALGGLGQLLVSEDVALTIKKIESMVGSGAGKSSVHLSFYNWDGRTEMIPYLKMCQEAIMQTKLLAFDYVDRGGSLTNRQVEPYQLHFSEMSWYLRGFCVDRMDYRTFKLSRMEKLQMTPRTFVPREADELPVQQHYEPELVTVKALVAHSIKEQFVERFGHKSIQPYDSGRSEVFIEVPQDRYGFQFLAGFGTNLEIIGPQSYADDFRMFLEDLIRLYT